MREGKAPRHLDRERERRRDRHRPLAQDHALEVFAVDELEHDERTAVVLASIDHGHDVRV